MSFPLPMKSTLNPGWFVDVDGASVTSSGFLPICCFPGQSSKPPNRAVETRFLLHEIRHWRRSRGEFCSRLSRYERRISIPQLHIRPFFQNEALSIHQHICMQPDSDECDFCTTFVVLKILRLSWVPLSANSNRTEKMISDMASVAAPRRLPWRFVCVGILESWRLLCGLGGSFSPPQATSRDTTDRKTDLLVFFSSQSCRTHRSHATRNDLSAAVFHERLLNHSLVHEKIDHS